MDDTPDNSQPPADVHHKIGQLTRQLHDSLNELGYADKLRGSMGELPDAQSRLSYIARLTGEAAEKVLNRVEQAKAQHDYIAAETRRVVNSLVADPVAAVAKGEIFNFLTDVERVTKEADVHLTEIMMAQDFHDLNCRRLDEGSDNNLARSNAGPFALHPTAFPKIGLHSIKTQD